MKIIKLVASILIGFAFILAFAHSEYALPTQNDVDHEQHDFCNLVIHSLPIKPQSVQMVSPDFTTIQQAASLSLTYPDEPSLRIYGTTSLNLVDIHISLHTLLGTFII